MIIGWNWHCSARGDEAILIAETVTTEYSRNTEIAMCSAKVIQERLSSLHPSLSQLPTSPTESVGAVAEGSSLRPTILG